MSASLRIEELKRDHVARALRVTHAPSGLHALIVLDELSLGPAAGGVRTRVYESEDLAYEDAARLARAMTIKCALGHLDAGGGKTTVLLHEGLKRRDAFRALGEAVESLGGEYHCAGDLGTTSADLAAMAETCSTVHHDEAPLAKSVARGMRRCAEAIANALERDLASLRLAVQGVGAIGEAVAHEFRDHEMWIADLDPERAERVASEVSATVVEPSAILCADVDILMPCAVGGVITEQVVRDMRAVALCPGANNVVADVGGAHALVVRHIAHVPDTVSSAGAVIDGIGRTVMGLSNREPLIDRLREVAALILDRAGERADVVAAQIAMHHIREVRERRA